MRIVFIGVGKMGEALIKGVLESDLFKKSEVSFCEALKDRARHIEKTYKINHYEELKDALKQCEIAVVAVKPQQLNGLVKELNKTSLKGKTLVSIAAGIPIGYYRKKLKEKVAIVRVMPNILATVKESISALSPSGNTSKTALKNVEMIFSGVGETVIVEEKYQNAVMALSGCGPAYFYLFAEALVASGVRVGLSREIASKLVFKTMKGSQEMLVKSGKHPAMLIDEVTSPGGTTIAALEQFESCGFRKSVFKAIKAAIKRAEELSQG